jgi:hypothetical protein
MNTTELFGDHAGAFARQPLSPEVLHQAKRTVTAWYACMFPGRHREHLQLMGQTLIDDLDRDRALVEAGRHATARPAAPAEVDSSVRDAINNAGAVTNQAARTLWPPRRRPRSLPRQRARRPGGPGPSVAGLESTLIELASPVIGADRAKTLLAIIWTPDTEP